MSTSVASEPSIFTPLYTFLGGFLIALFAEPLRQWLLRPKLKVEFGQSEDYISPTPEQVGPQQREVKAVYVRVKVTNKSARLAKGCRAFLVKVEKQGSTGRFEPTLYCDSIQLAWSARLPDDAHGGVDLPQDIPQFFDILSTRANTPVFFPKLAVMPHRYLDLFIGHGFYRFTIRVSGDWVTPAAVQIDFKWNGKWDNFTARLAD